MTTSYRFAKRTRKASVASKIVPILATGFGFVAFALTIPSNTSSKPEARIFTQGLSIQLDRSSPAYAALEDTLSADTQSMSEIAEAQLIQAAPSHVLMSGVAVSEPVALKIVRENRREESLMAQEREQRRLNSMALVAALSNALPTVAQPAPPRQVANTIATSGLAAKEITEIQAAGGTVISNGQVVSGGAFVNPQTKTISRKELAQFFAPFIRPAPGQIKAPIAPQGSRSLPSMQVASKGADSPAARVATLTTSAIAGRLTQQDTTTPPINQNTGVHQLVISGPVEFSGGVAITSASDRVIVYRELDEEKLEPAQVWLKDARYEIFVDQPVGRLVAELRSSAGEVLGRGSYDLAQLPKLDGKTYRVDKISMMIGPVPQGISGVIKTVAVASDANPGARSVPVKNAHVQLGQLPFETMSKKDGTFKDTNLIEGSTVIAHSDRPGHWASLAFASAGSPIELPMFTDATVRGIMLAATGSDHENERNTSLIWGRITRGGVPVAGAHADLMTGDAQPVYFNKMMLPDPTLKATSENGLYAFFPVEPGSHAVQAGDSHGVTEPNLFPTDQQTVTQVNLELNVSKGAQLRVYDAFKTDWPLSAEVQSAGRKHGAIVPKSGQMTVTFTGGNGVLVLDADAGASYEHVRVMATKTERKIDFPMVQSGWLDRIRGAMRVNQDPHTGTIVGFIRGTPAYQVSLENESLGPNTKVLYFDAKGELTGKNYGEAGGGFLLFNVPQGFRTVLVQPSGTTKALASAILVEDSITNVINKTF